MLLLALIIHHCSGLTGICAKETVRGRTSANEPGGITNLSSGPGHLMAVEGVDGVQRRRPHLKVQLTIVEVFIHDSNRVLHEL